MIAFEIHTYREGRWRIDAVFDDRDVALFEAQRIAARRRHVGVLVVEETWDAATNTATSRTLFRGGRFANRIWRVLPELRRRMQQAGARARRGRERLPTGAAPEAGGGRRFSFVRVLFTFVALMLIGLAALLGLRALSAFLLHG